jgi:uncharacterized protein (TIGR00725 family)
MKQTYIGVIGGSSCSQEIENLAFKLGKYIAENGWILVCGGMGGVMQAACRGAYTSGGTTLGILPGSDREEGNPYLTYSIVTDLGHSRNLIVIQSSDALVAVDGGYGTLSEIAFANILGKPIIGLLSWQLHAQENSGSAIFSKEAKTVEEVIRLLKQFV